MKRKLLTQKEAVALCRELWVWLSHHGTKDKDDWPRWERNGGDVRECDCDCPLCEYNKTHGRRYCNDNCLLVWNLSHCLSSEFGAWNRAEGNHSEHRRIAKVIANLPVRKGVRA